MPPRPHRLADWTEDTVVPPWPRSAADMRRLSALADWAEDSVPEELHRRREAEWQRQTGLTRDEARRTLLRADEKAMLVSAFAGSGAEGRWDAVAAHLSDRNHSAEFVRIVAEILRLGGFSSKARLDDYDDLKIAEEVDLTSAVLAQHYPDRGTQAVAQMATRLVAIRLLPASDTPDAELLRRQTADVQRARKRIRDGHKADLRRLCWLTTRSATIEDHEEAAPPT
ncbi:MAG: hypothetical protein K5872_20925 [Rhizobiaceae bacterium]|nr:hypothetical protein [Rhizobiaceae bacterium]MCV0408681.1 hypothetical protein [Rhizobiaceae bacterium]